jgi:four helix bundle protein
MNNVKRFEELEVWKESRSLSKDIYNQFKSRERFADRPLALQIIRSSGSVTDNIAEGFERGGNKEFLQYLWISKASAGECRSQLYRAFDSELLSQEELDALPRIEDLTEGSDIRTFLRAGVPRQLRNAAMRRMWMLTPGIRDYSDPAVDYAWDWNTPGGVPGDGIGPTAENAAKMLKQLFKPQDDDPIVASAKPDPTVAKVAAVPPVAETGQVEEAEDDKATAPDITHAATDDPPCAPDLPPRRRHGSALPG